MNAVPEAGRDTGRYHQQRHRARLVVVARRIIVIRPSLCVERQRVVERRLASHGVVAAVALSGAASE